MARGGTGKRWAAATDGDARERASRAAAATGATASKTLEKNNKTYIYTKALFSSPETKKIYKISCHIESCGTSMEH